MTVDQDAGWKTEALEVYWMPGCSSCLRMKEFIETTEVSYESINLDTFPERGQRLTQLGLTVPAVIRGSHHASGVDLERVAEVVGVDWTAPVILDPAILKAKYDIVANAILRLLPQIPDGGLEYKHPLRDRSLRALIAHAGAIMRGQFLQPYTDDSFDRLSEGPLDLQMTGTTDDLEEWVSVTLQEFDAWWARDGFDDTLERVLDTHWGHRTLLEILERAVWHTAQHTRQIAAFIQDLGVQPEGALTSADLAGLPVPERVVA